MASKKLAPDAQKTTNPRVPAHAVNPPVANGAYQVDQRGTADQDGNAGQAQKADAVRSAPSRNRKHKHGSPRRAE